MARTPTAEQIKASLPPMPAPIGKTPKITNPKQLAAAIACLAGIDARTAAVSGKRQAETDQVNQRWADHLNMEVGGQQVPFEKYRADVLAAINLYVPDHKPDIFTDGKQTARFACGQVSYKSKPGGVAMASGTKADDIATAIAKKSKLQATIDELLKKLDLVGWLNVKVSLDLQGIKKRFKDGKLKKSQLKKGLIVEQKTETIEVKAFASPERSEAA